MKNVMSKKFLAFCTAAAFVCVAPLAASAVDKLVVKDASEAPVFIVDDTGKVGIANWIGVGTTTPDYPFTMVAPDSAPNLGQFALKLPFPGEDNAAFTGWLTNDSLEVTYFAQMVFNNIDRTTGSETGMIKYTTRDAGAWGIRMVINGSNVGIGTTTPSYPLEMASGAHVTTGGVWTDASSRELKENIHDLSVDDAVNTLTQLNPVQYNYKSDKAEQYVGFIAEDVPEIVAINSRKGLSPMDITAVLTKVLQEQHKTIAKLQEKIANLEADMMLKQNKPMVSMSIQEHAQTNPL